MILSDSDILDEIEAGRLEISPLSDLEEQLQPASVDLRLSTTFYTFETDRDVVVTPDRRSIRDEGRKVEHERGEPFELQPGAFVLVDTAETVRLPDDVCGVLFGRSGYGRLGVVPHNGAAFVNPGWSGRLTLELTNHGPHTVRLLAGETCPLQIVFLRLGSTPNVPYGERSTETVRDSDGDE